MKKLLIVIISLMLSMTTLALNTEDIKEVTSSWASSYRSDVQFRGTNGFIYVYNKPAHDEVILQVFEGTSLIEFTLDYADIAEAIEQSYRGEDVMIQKEVEAGVSTSFTRVFTVVLDGDSFDIIRYSYDNDYLDKKYGKVIGYFSSLPLVFPVYRD
jgi:hypothetical protein